MIQSFPYLDAADAQYVFSRSYSVISKNFLPHQSGGNILVGQTKSVVCNEYLVVKTFINIFFKVICIKDDRITKPKFKAIGEILNFRIWIEKVASLSPIDNFSPEKTLRQEIGWKQIEVLQFHEIDDNIDPLPVNEPQDPEC